MQKRKLGKGNLEVSAASAPDQDDPEGLEFYRLLTSIMLSSDMRSISLL